jgi:peptidoglycan/xylan/chitin deacetylase (PgdA/CDA1 family)
MTALGDVAGFMYHEVTDDPSSSGFQRPGARPYDCTPGTFAEHLALVRASERSTPLVTTLDLERAYDAVLLTFDDGGRSALDAAAAMDRVGLRGHFFIVTERLGTRGFLSRGDVRALRRAGHLIGSHSHTHPDIFSGLAPHTMREEWSTSRWILEDLLAEPVTCASIPGGDLSYAVAESAAASGFTVLFTSEPWRRPRRVADCWLVGRIAVRAGFTNAQMTALLDRRGWDGALLRRRCSVLARRGLGPLYRLYVERRTAADRAGGGVR